ncbi:MAG: TonB-dependent receptor plug domain-containing protein [Pirellulales bacterium]
MVRDSAVVEDTLVGDLPGELTGVLVDSAAAAQFAVLAPPVPLDPVAGDVVTWGRDLIRRSNATSLSELVAAMVPGVTLLRANFFGGPHHLVDGPFGPGAVDIRVEGRPLVPIIGSQADLSQIPLAAIDQVSVRRGAAGLEVDLTMLRRTERRAYSRVEAGTGDPGLEGLRLVFTNGVGSQFTIASAFDLLDVGGSFPTELQAFWGSVAWIPGDGQSGLELQYDGGSFDRVVGGSETGSRSRIVLGGRLAATEHVRVSGWIGESTRELDAQVATGAPSRRDEATDAGLDIRATWDKSWVRAGARLTDNLALPSTEVTMAAGARPIPWLTLTAAGKLGSWADFDTQEGRIAVDVDLPIGDLRVGGEATAGVRGAPFIRADDVRADSVQFEAIAGRIELPVGGFLVVGRAEHQRVDRQVAFGTGFDVAGSFQPQVNVTGLEIFVEGPVLPMTWLLGELDPVRIRGFYRRNELNTPRTPFFLPINSLRGELFFHDVFLENDLEIRIGIGIDRRDAWLTPPIPGDGSIDPVMVPSRTSWDLDLGIRIVGVLIFWRFDNVAGTVQQDLPGLQFPVRRSVFGLRWEFLD